MHKLRSQRNEEPIVYRDAFLFDKCRATYQRTVTTLLHDMMHKEVEVYVDDMIVKSKDRNGHFEALQKFFERLRKYNMRLNPQKCAFGVTSGKLLGHIVSHRGIEVDPSKIKAIIEMPPPETEKQIRGFLGRVQYISRFVAKLTMICEPIFKKLKVGEHEIWDEQCQAAFDKVKEVLSSPPVLSPPVSGYHYHYISPLQTPQWGLC